MKKVSILFLLHLPPPIHGSSMVGQFIRQSNIINDNFTCKYINLLASNELSHTGRISLSKIFRFIGTWSKLLYELLRNKPNLCYFALTTTGAAFFRDFLLVFLLRIFRVKYVFHLHNKGVSNKKNNWIYNALYHFVFKEAYIILLSELLYKDIKQYVKLEKIYICANGIPPVDLQINGKTKRNKKINILFLSNLIESKGVNILIDACKILKNKQVSFICNFVGGEGDISEEMFAQSVNLAEIDDCVFFLGKKFGKEKHDIFIDSSIFVLPTFQDCFPLVLLEAMQHKLPVITTDEGGIKSIVDDSQTGYIVPQGDSLSLAEKLEMLINDPQLCNKLGSAGYVKYQNYFTLNKFENTLLEILNKLLINE